MLRLFTGLKYLAEQPIRHISTLSKIPSTKLLQFNQNAIVQSSTNRNYSIFHPQFNHVSPSISILNKINSELLKPQTGLITDQSRSVTKFSLRKGKRKSVMAVLDRFYRLHWGAWIRTKAGKHKRLWKKSSARKRRLKNHVFCNSTQSWMLDKMVTKFWRRPKYWVDNIYEPYNTREEFYITRTKPHDPDEITPPVNDHSKRLKY